MENSIEIEEIKYKPAKTTDEMIDKLYTFKNVRYNIISKDDAKDILLRYNYINVITPFKHNFAKKDKNGKLIKINGNHVYEREVEFSEYFNYYNDERKKYPIIYTNISTFETHFKAITTYHILNDIKDKIETPTDLKQFLLKIKTSIALQNVDFSDKRIANMINEINSISSDEYISKYSEVYVFFDRLSLGVLLNIFIGLDKNLQNSIFNDMLKYKQTLETGVVTQFINRTFKLVGIRNYIMHNNSLEILIRFYDSKDKTSLRKPREREAYSSLINLLSKEK